MEAAHFRLQRNDGAAADHFFAGIFRDAYSDHRSAQYRRKPQKTNEYHIGENRQGAHDGPGNSDGQRLLQVLTNLLSNAVKFTPENGRIDLTVRQIDVEINREIVSTLLAPSGIRIIEAEDGNDAIKKFERFSSEIDIIFMDIKMPVMDGFSAASAIRSSGFQGADTVPIIALTANAFQDDIDKARAVGMNGHLSKPIDIDKVFAMMSKYL